METDILHNLITTSSQHHRFFGTENDGIWFSWEEQSFLFTCELSKINHFQEYIRNKKVGHFRDNHGL